MAYSPFLFDTTLIYLCGYMLIKIPLILFQAENLLLDSNMNIKIAGKPIDFELT